MNNPVAPDPFRTRAHLRWADIDANFHLRHSVYYDLCAQQRMSALTDVGISLMHMRRGGYGPVLFKEECTFRREIKLEDEIWIVLRRCAVNEPSRFSFVHTFIKADATYCARLVVTGAWIDTRLRKITVPPFDPELMERIPLLEEDGA